MGFANNKKSNPLESQTLGDAHFATPDEVTAARLLGQTGIRLGYYKGPEDRGEDWGEVLRYDGDAHLITVAPTRSGKGRDVLIPALLEYPGSCIVIDPKGQLAAVTKVHRDRPVAEGGLGQEIILLNPFNLLEEELGPTACYNPMVTLDPQSDSFGSDCDSLADAIIVNDNRGDSHWPDSARQLVSGIIMHLAANEAPEFQNLATVRSVVSGPVEELNRFIDEALKADRDGDGFITGRLARFENINDESREMLGIISSAITQTGFIGNKAITRSLRGSDFRFRDLKLRPTTVFLILPANQLASCGKWFRLVIASALADLWSETRGAVPVLAILDEFAQLGRLQAIENAMGLAAGFGLQLWPVLQNLTQLKRDYGDNWETFLGSAAVRQFFAPQDDFTAEYVSKMCGVKTVVTQGQSVQHATELLEKSRDGTSWGQQSRPLLHPHNVRSLGPQESLILGPQNIVIDAFRKPYGRTPEFEGLYNPDPYHKTDAMRVGSGKPSEIPAPADSFAARETIARHEMNKALARKRPLPVRLLTWGSSDNAIINGARKIEYFLTLPLRLVAAMAAIPFAIHNRPLGAALGILAVFGFWEVWNDFAKEPLVSLYRMKSQEYQTAAWASNPNSMGDVLNSNYRAAKWVVEFPFRNFFGSDDPPRPAGRPSQVQTPQTSATRIDSAVEKVSRVLNDQAKKQWDNTQQNIDAGIRDALAKGAAVSKKLDDEVDARQAADFAKRLAAEEERKRQVAEEAAVKARDCDVPDKPSCADFFAQRDKAARKQ